MKLATTIGDLTFEAQNTIRLPDRWPHYRPVSPQDKLLLPPVAIQQKQMSVMHDIGEWILQSYGITPE